VLNARQFTRGTNCDFLVRSRGYYFNRCQYALIQQGSILRFYLRNPALRIGYNRCVRGGLESFLESGVSSWRLWMIEKL
jgi:hypothetical protein